jgi:hypothetical protein
MREEGLMLGKSGRVGVGSLLLGLLNQEGLLMSKKRLLLLLLLWSQ